MLTNLPVDADVIGHEFGHHIIYQTITSVSGESLILHEGLADYFTFAHTKDDSLGESICPAGSLACWTKGQCLRTANNDINFSSLEYTNLICRSESPGVVGQDTENRRGADIQVRVTVPPVIFTWYEPIYEERDVCRSANSGETANCNTGAGSAINDGVSDTEMVFKECRTHVEHLPDAVKPQATAALDAASQDWITGRLGQTHYEAFVHQANFTLIPGIGSWTGGCNGGGTCILLLARHSAFHLQIQEPSTCEWTQ